MNVDHPQRSSLVLGTNFEQLGRVLKVMCILVYFICACHVLMTVITSDRSEGLWNKKLKVRIQQLLGAIKAGVPPQAFQNGVNQLPANFQQFLQS